MLPLIPVLVASFLLTRLSGAAGSSDDQAAPATGTLVGQVVQGPMCPPSPLNPPGSCDDVPFAGELVVETADGTIEVARVTADEMGEFSLVLEPGTYLVLPLTPGDQAYPRAVPQVVDIPPDSPTSIVVHYDSGIR